MPLIPIKHWALSFEFFDEMNSSKSWTMELKHQIEGQCQVQIQGFRCERYSYTLGTIWISPNSLIEMAKNLPQSHGKYNLIYQNCQTWVLSFLKKLNQELEQNFISHLELQKWSNHTIGVFVLSFFKASLILFFMTILQFFIRNDGSKK